MATRDQVRELLAAGEDYPAAAARLGITAGQAYLTGTGRPADSSGTAADADPDPPPGPILSSPQRLTNPPGVNPTSDGVVRDWIRRRAAADLTAP